MAKVALDENIDIVLLSGGLFSNSTPDEAVLLFACHKLRKVVTRGEQAIGFDTLGTSSGEDPW